MEVNMCRFFLSFII